MLDGCCNEVGTSASLGGREHHPAVLASEVSRSEHELVREVRVTHQTAKRHPASWTGITRAQHLAQTDDGFRNSPVR